MPTESGARYESPGFRKGVLFSTGDRFDGELNGFRTDGDAYLMFYHQDLLDVSGRTEAL